jgi:hypothetical protein
MVVPRHLAAEQLAEALRRLGGVVHGDLDAVATIKHAATLPQ